MSNLRSGAVDRRQFLVGASALGAASLLCVPSQARSEAPLETTRIRLVNLGAICLTPGELLAEQFLRLEGFTEVEYVPLRQNTAPDLLMQNRADMTAWTPPGLMPDLDAGKPLVALTGIHGGCYELFASERVRTVRDLKGKRIAISALNSAEYYFIASFVGYVGMDPRKDIQWVVTDYDGMTEQFIAGKVDAVLAFPPQPDALRKKGAGHVVLNTGQDRPWNQFYCCMITARRDFVSSCPAATKRAVRAILKATDLCAKEPERVARFLVSRGSESNYQVVLDSLRGLDYNRWRTYDAEDSLRFYGVRLHEAGLIKNNPNKLIAEGTDWRFLNELKRELKA